MLGSLLPAFRHIRTPVVVGWLYATLAWLAADFSFQTSDRGAGPFERMLHLADLVGPTATMVAVSFSLYILGTFLVIRRWPLRGPIIDWLDERHRDWESEQQWPDESQIDSMSVRELRRLPKPPIWLRLLTQAVYIGSYRSPIVIEPVWPYERVDGYGTGMTLRTTAPWARTAGDWVRRVSEQCDHAFTYQDLRDAFGHDSEFMRVLRKEWETGRRFLFERANNEFGFKKADATAGIRWVEDPGEPGVRYQQEGEPYELDPDSLESRHLPPWDPGPDGWSETTSDPWWAYDKNMSETVKERYLNESLLATLKDELEFVVTKLRVEGSRIFDEYDRKQSEAELRYSMFLPLCGIALVASFQWSPWASISLLLPLALLRQGFRSEREAIVDVFAALRYEVVKAPIVERFEQAKQRHEVHVSVEADGA